MQKQLKGAKRAYLVNKVVDFLYPLTGLLVRGTCVWIGTLLVGLPSLGLPALSWVQAVGIVLVVRPIFTHVIGVKAEPPQELAFFNKALASLSQQQVGGPGEWPPMESEDETK